MDNLEIVEKSWKKIPMLTHCMVFRFFDFMIDLLVVFEIFVLYVGGHEKWCFIGRN